MMTRPSQLQLPQTPHAEILEQAKPLLEKEGYDLEVTVFDDYVQTKRSSRER